MEHFSPEKVVSKALAAEEGLTFYGELEVEIDGIEDLDGSVVKEWQKNEKSRSEVQADGKSIIFVNDGKSIIFYEVEEKKALIMEDDSLADLQMNPKEQVEMILDAVKDTHEIETIGEDTVADRAAFHLSAIKKKGEKSLFGDQEFWIDKEHWVVLKMKATTGDSQNIVQYTKIDFNAKFDDSIFQLDLPEDVVIETLDDKFTEEEIELTDISEKMGQDILYLSNSNEYKVGAITYTEMDGEPQYSDITIDYKKNDGLPLMTLTIVEVESDETDEEDMGLLEEDVVEEVTIRNEKGMFLEFDDFRSVSWDEAGLSYSINLIDKDLSMDELQKWLDEMDVIE